MASSEFEVAGFKYQSDSLNARAQFHIARRLLPVLTKIRPLAVAWAQSELQTKEGEPVDEKAVKFGNIRDELFSELGGALSKLSDADCDFVINECLGVTYRLDGMGGRQPMWNKLANREMFSDLDMMSLMTIVSSILQANLMSFFH